MHYLTRPDYILEPGERGNYHGPDCDVAVLRVIPGERRSCETHEAEDRGDVAAQWLFTYAPVMNRLFHTAPISADAWPHILAVGIAAFAAVGPEKWLRTHATPKRA